MEWEERGPPVLGVWIAGPEDGLRLSPFLGTNADVLQTGPPVSGTRLLVLVRVLIISWEVRLARQPARGSRSHAWRLPSGTSCRQSWPVLLSLGVGFLFSSPPDHNSSSILINQSVVPLGPQVPTFQYPEGLSDPLPSPKRHTIILADRKPKACFAE